MSETSIPSARCPTPSPAPQLVLHGPDLARLLGVGRTRAYELIHQIPQSFALGDRPCVLRDDLDAYLRERRDAAARQRRDRIGARQQRRTPARRAA